MWGVNIHAQYFESNKIFGTGSYGVTAFKSDKNLYVCCAVGLKNVAESIGWLVLDTNLNYVRSFVPKDTIRLSSSVLYHDGYLVQYGQSTVNKADSAVFVKMDTLGNVLKRRVYSTKDTGTRRYLPVQYHNSKYYAGISVWVTATALDRMIIEVYDTNLAYEKSIKLPVSAGGLDLINFIVVDDNNFIAEYLSYAGFQQPTYHSIVSFFTMGNITITRWKYQFICFSSNCNQQI